MPLAAISELNIAIAQDHQATCVVVISHDCDLANDNLNVEPDVEVIIGCHLDKADGNYLWSKSPRILHLDALFNDKPTVIQLTATAKFLIPKCQLAAFLPDTGYSFSGKSLATLRGWLAVRYNRAAFPNPFIDRLREYKVSDRLAKIVEPVGHHLLAVYFDLDDGKDLNHEDGSVYGLKIVLLYLVGEEPEQTMQEMEKLEASIYKLFESKYYDSSDNLWNGIELEVCMAISEDDLTVRKAKLLREWRLEYMTHKAEHNSS